MNEDDILSHPSLVHTVSVSGGKDSTATYCTAIEKLGPTGFRAVAADTGNEHPATYEQINRLHEWTGGPKVEWVAADFTPRLVAKRAFIAANWCRPNGRGAPAVSDERIALALAALDDRLAHPEQANPYLDLCLWKGRFPSRKAQFCTEHLKVFPIQAWQRELLRAGRIVISWQGVRAAESFERSLLDKIQQLDAETAAGEPVPGQLWTYRPLLDVASIEEVFEIGARHGVPPNPLYSWGLTRVGCFPCVNCKKSELAIVDRHHGPQIDRLENWEGAVSTVSRRGNATFFAVANDTVMLSELAYFEALGAPLTITAETHGIRRAVQWAKTERGGRQLGLFNEPPSMSACNAHGACE